MAENGENRRIEKYVKKSGQIERSSALGSLKVRKVSRIFYDVFFVSKFRIFEFSRQNLGSSVSLWI